MRTRTTSTSQVQQSVRLEGSGQFITYVEHVLTTVKTSNHQLRITVRIGGYKDQSWGKVERWNGQEWKDVAVVEGPALTVDMKVGYSPEAGRLAQFSADRNKLYALALEGAVMALTYTKTEATATLADQMIGAAQILERQARALKDGAKIIRANGLLTHDSDDWDFDVVAHHRMFKVSDVRTAAEAASKALEEPQPCDHNEMIERPADSKSAWACAKCGYVYGD